MKNVSLRNDQCEAGGPDIWPANCPYVAKTLMLRFSRAL